jgi:hypothetical protein
MNGAAGRLIVAVYNGNSGGITVSSVVYDPSGANVTLGLDATFGPGSFGGYGSFYSGTVPANIQVTLSSATNFTIESIAVWNAQNLTTGYGGASAGGFPNVSLTVPLSSFLFAMTGTGSSYTAGANTFSTSAGSSQNPTAFRDGTPLSPATGINSSSSDWSSPTPGSFTVQSQSSPPAGFIFAATYK